MWGINGTEALIIAVLAFVLIGPDRLPELVAGIKKVVAKAKGTTEQVQTELRAEYGEDIAWEKLDPRKYHPRNLVAEVWQESGAQDHVEAPASLPRFVTPKRDGNAPFDDEAT